MVLSLASETPVRVCGSMDCGAVSATGLLEMIVERDLHAVVPALVHFLEAIAHLLIEREPRWRRIVRSCGAGSLQRLCCLDLLCFFQHRHFPRLAPVPGYAYLDRRATT